MKNQDDPLAEIEALKSVVSALTPLDEQARARVLNWVTAKFNISTAGRHMPALPLKIQPFPDPTAEPATPTGQDLATIFSATSPETESDKALVVAYWLQTSKGQEAFDSQEVNGELKHLGHGVKNITRALEVLISTKPQLVIQTRKSGITKQARKKYRVTGEEIARVTQMASGGASRADKE